MNLAISKVATFIAIICIVNNSFASPDGNPADATLQRQNSVASEQVSPIISQGPNLQINGPTVTHYNPPQGMDLIPVTRYLLQGRLIEDGCSYSEAYSAIPHPSNSGAISMSMITYDLARDPVNCQVLRERARVERNSKTPVSPRNNDQDPSLDKDTNSERSQNSFATANAPISTQRKSDTFPEENKFRNRVRLYTYVTDGNSEAANSDIAQLLGFPVTVAGVDEVVNDEYAVPNRNCIPSGKTIASPAAISGVTDVGFFWSVEEEDSETFFSDENCSNGFSVIGVRTDARFFSDSNPALVNLILGLSGFPPIDCSEGVNINYVNHSAALDYSNSGLTGIPEPVFVNELTITGDSQNCSENLQVVGPLFEVELGAEISDSN